MWDEDNQMFMLIDKRGMNEKSWIFSYPFTLKIKISYDFQIIPQLFHYSISIPEPKIIPKHPKMEQRLFHLETLCGRQHMKSDVSTD
jgi:hypothetical protein